MEKEIIEAVKAQADWMPDYCGEAYYHPKMSDYYEWDVYKTDTGSNNYSGSCCHCDGSSMGIFFLFSAEVTSNGIVVNFDSPLPYDVQ